MAAQRYLEPDVAADLAEKMVMVAGPRQVGKTTLAKRLLAESKSGIYLSWDNQVPEVGLGHLAQRSYAAALERPDADRQ